MRKEVRGGSVCLGWTLRVVERLTFKGSDQGCVKELPCPPLRTLVRLENRYVQSEFSYSSHLFSLPTQ